MACEQHHNRCCEIGQIGLTPFILVKVGLACQFKPQTALFQIISNYLFKNRSTMASAVDTVMKLSTPQ
jgi:hypothetical protein